MGGNRLQYGFLVKKTDCHLKESLSYEEEESL